MSELEKPADPPVTDTHRSAGPRREAARTWTAGELAHQLRFVPADTEVFIVGRGDIERMSGFATRLRRRARPLLRRVFGIRVRPSDEGPLVAYIEGKPI